MSVNSILLKFESDRRPDHYAADDDDVQLQFHVADATD